MTYGEIAELIKKLGGKQGWSDEKINKTILDVLMSLSEESAKYRCKDLMPIKEIREKCLSDFNSEMLARIIFYQIKERLILIQEYTTDNQNELITQVEYTIEMAKIIGRVDLIEQYLKYIQELKKEYRFYESLTIESKELYGYLDGLVKSGKVTIPDSYNKIPESPQNDFYKELLKLEYRSRLIYVFALYPQFEKDYPILKGESIIEERDKYLYWNATSKSLIQYFEKQPIPNDNQYKKKKKRLHQDV
jgi:hypothetical protein